MTGKFKFSSETEVLEHSILHTRCTCTPEGGCCEHDDADECCCHDEVSCRIGSSYLQYQREPSDKILGAVRFSSWFLMRHRYCVYLCRTNTLYKWQEALLVNQQTTRQRKENSISLKSHPRHQALSCLFPLHPSQLHCHHAPMQRLFVMPRQLQICLLVMTQLLM